ncbi:MAG: protein translocase subunit SecD [Acidobacteriota bacterium]|nr:protein translocase subunit SecD [Acidobacteriota bacterium]
MSRDLLWRGLLIAGVVVGAIFLAHPIREKINLGLDLRGGIHLVLRVETADALRSETNKYLVRVLQEAEDRDLEGATGNATSDRGFELTGIAATADSTIRDIATEFLPGWVWSRRGEVLNFEMTSQNVADIANQSVRQAQETIRNRVDAFGVAEPVILRQGVDRIVVQLPGVDDPERVKRLIKNTAFLDFRLVDFPRSGPGVGTREEVLANYGGAIPDNVEISRMPIRDEQGETVAEQFYGLEKRSVITGRDLRTARPGLGEFNQPIVNFFLTPEGGKAFAAATGANVGRSLAIVLDGQVRSAPRINSRIADQGLIEGDFTRQEVEDLSTVLRSGALPAGITYLEERTVGPSLGQDSIDRGFKAGVLGLGLIILAMLVVYRGAGINAVVALSLNIVLIFGALSYFGATLTLPGIAGIILTIGMAVDANVLIFERIREELRHGRTVRSAVDAGFSKALSSVLDANITTLIAALFLFQFGTGPIRGFAVTLSIGIFASLFSAIFVSRWLFDLMVSRRQRVARLSI